MIKFQHTLGNKQYVSRLYSPVNPISISMSDHPVLTTGIPHSPSLLFLNENVLECILDELESKDQIRYTSLTCKRIREICMPILFQSCTVSITTILDTTRFLPAAIWPYVR